MRGFRGSSENHTDNQRNTGYRATFASGMFLGPLPLDPLNPFGDKKRINVFA